MSICFIVVRKPEINLLNLKANQSIEMSKSPKKQKTKQKKSGESSWAKRFFDALAIGNRKKPQSTKQKSAVSPKVRSKSKKKKPTKQTIVTNSRSKSVMSDYHSANSDISLGSDVPKFNKISNKLPSPSRFRLMRLSSRADDTLDLSFQNIDDNYLGIVQVSPNIDKIANLNLSHNSFQSINSGDILSFQNLQSINLSYNQISNLQELEDLIILISELSY